MYKNKLQRKQHVTSLKMYNKYYKKLVNFYYSYHAFQNPDRFIIPTKVKYYILYDKPFTQHQQRMVLTSRHTPF